MLLLVVLCNCGWIWLCFLFNLFFVFVCFFDLVLCRLRFPVIFIVCCVSFRGCSGCCISVLSVSCLL
jgi:hypothetical protein